MTESTIQSKILNYLNQDHNTWAVKIISSNKRGCPDIICCHKGWFVAIEVKTQDGIASPIQINQLGSIKKCKGIAMVARSDEDVKAVFSEIKESPK